jgi:hypothetical protein
VTVSDTVAPPLTNVHVPVHAPARLSSVGAGVVVEPPQAESSRLHASSSARPRA